MTILVWNNKWKKEMRGKIECYSFRVGVIQDKNHKRPKPLSKGLKAFPASGQARKIGRKSSMTISQVSESLRKRTRINIYSHPFKNKKNKDIIVFVKSFLDFALKNKATIKRLENTLQAIVRNPITRGDYGVNSPKAAKIKGFNKLMIDTGQLFTNIKAKVNKIAVGVK